MELLSCAGVMIVGMIRSQPMSAQELRILAKTLQAEMEAL
jgi:hypothetical protein